MSSIRDQRQEEFANLWIEKGEWGILNLVARFGKIRTTILILKKQKYKRVLISYPDLKIKAAWQSDFEVMGYDDSNVEYTTHISLKKYIEENYDLMVLDEIHLLSPAQIEIVKLMKGHNRVILGLSGTISSWTKKDLLTELHLPVVATYTIAQAISEGVIADYDITIIKVPLDRVIKLYKGKTEKQKFDNLSWVIAKFEKEGKATFFLRLQRMRIIQNSIAKLNKTKELIQTYKNDRLLIFMGTINMCDSLNIPTYHSKILEKSVFENFVNGDGKSLVVCKIGNTGTTYKNLNYVIMNYFSSSSEDMVQKLMRALTWEYNNPNKKAKIIIISSNESVEDKWLSNALSQLDSSRIKYI